MEKIEVDVTILDEKQLKVSSTNSATSFINHAKVAFIDPKAFRKTLKDLVEKCKESKVKLSRKTVNALLKEESEYLAAAQELAAAHPELGQDGLEADKVLALSDVYRNNGMSAVEALRKAVADLYPEAPAPEPEAPAPVEEPEPEAPAPVEEPEIPDMEERKEKKKSIPAMPSASARNEPLPPLS